MGMDLRRGDEVYSVGAVFWHECLELAEAFGWKPAGTLFGLADLEHLPPHTAAAEYERRRREWTGIYTSNDWQRVTDEDAYALAFALYNAVVVMEAKLDMTDVQKRTTRTVTRSLIEISRSHSAMESDYHYLRRIAEFIDRGGFEIG
jgi:hypothetical protein